MRLLYCLMAEGRLSSTYADDRAIYLDKPDIWTTGKEIRETLNDHDAQSAVRFFKRYCEMGMPFGTWGDAPNPVIATIEALAPLRDKYKPRLM